ncbi:MAG: AraC family transcriptional regulator [Butyrivibrio sp.]|uniref:AraC family transcriptional regulator n=1 Tax=Butyrivibrio sp. TaxID=28121 RepID=UPI0025FBE98D|nr:AraC family transcriptional regulator [Butyrivibrio sp.]MCR5771924.1 AraC family transcriptional regulator [Butyrivibrio sp.]
MFLVKYRKDFSGIAVGRIERNQDFTAKQGFYHNEYQIQYIYSGERYFFADGQCYKMTPGTITFIDKKQIPKTNIIGGKYHDRLLIEMKESFFEPLCTMIGFDIAEFFESHHGVYQVGNNEIVQDFLNKVAVIMTSKDEDNKGVRLKIEVINIMLEKSKWEKNKIHKFDEVGVQTHIEKQKRVHQVADYIAENYNRINSVSELSKQFYMSNAYLCRIFKEVTNFTISEYINLCRIAESKRYLEDERYTMAEIANRLGYDSLTYFERVFKKQMTITPLQYRKSLLRNK